MGFLTRLIKDSDIAAGAIMAWRSVANNTVMMASLDSDDPTEANRVRQRLAKAWVNFRGSTGNINSSFNVSSVTRNGAGDYTINFTSALADASYTVVGGFRPGSAFGILGVSAGVAPTTLACRVATVDHTGVAIDPGDVYVEIFGI